MFIKKWDYGMLYTYNIDSCLEYIVVTLFASTLEVNEYLLSAMYRGLKKSKCEILFALKGDYDLIQETDGFIANKTQCIEGCHTTKWFLSFFETGKYQL